jgi:hypothetical protein
VNHGFLAGYAREIPSLLQRLTHSEPPPAKLAELGAFFLEATDVAEVAVAEGGSCGFAVEFTSVELSPDETNRQRVLDAINDNATFCGTEADGSILNARRRLVFLAKDEARARVIESALKQRALQVRFEAGINLANRPEQNEFNKALRSAAARAARAATFERSGRRLSVTLSVEPNPAEQVGMAKLLDLRKAMATRAAEVVRGLVAGKLPSSQQLEGFVTAATSAPER